MKRGLDLRCSRAQQRINNYITQLRVPWEPKEVLTWNIRVDSVLHLADSGQSVHCESTLLHDCCHSEAKLLHLNQVLEICRKKSTRNARKSSWELLVGPLARRPRVSKRCQWWNIITSTCVWETAMKETVLQDDRAGQSTFAYLCRPGFHVSQSGFTQNLVPRETVQSSLTHTE